MELRRIARRLAVAAPALAALSVLAAAPGCETTQLFQGNPEEAEPDDDEWRATEAFEAKAFDDVWLRTQATLDRMGFALDEERTHYERREVVSKWLTHLSPFRLQGFRRRAHVQIDPAGSKWVVRAAVLLQRNADIDNPVSAAQAQWEQIGVDANRTALLVFRIRSAFDAEAGGVLAVPAETPDAPK